MNGPCQAQRDATTWLQFQPLGCSPVPPRPMPFDRRRRPASSVGADRNL